MADLRITDLNALAKADVSGVDVLPVADVSASETKKVTVADLVGAGIALVSAGTIPGSAIVSDSVTATQIAADAITSSELADGSVDTAAIQASAVTDAKIASGISGSKLTDGTVTGAKIASSSINRGLDITSGAIGHTNTVTATSVNGIAFDSQGHITSITPLTSGQLPIATTTNPGVVSIPSTSGLSVSGIGVINHASSVTAATVSGITFSSTGHITAAVPLTAADIPNATQSTKGGVSVPAGDLTVGSGSLSHTASGVTIGTYPKVTVNANGHVTAGTALVAGDIPSLPASILTSGTLSTALLGTKSIEGVKLADFSTVLFGGAGSTSGVVTFPTPQFTGQQFFDSNQGDLYIFDGNAWQPITVISGDLVYAGTYNAATQKVKSITTQGSAAGLAVGSNLPAASSSNIRYYVVVSDSGTGTAPAPTVALAPPDMVISNGATWDLVDVSGAIAGQSSTNISFTPYGNISATNVQNAIQELDDEKLAKVGGTVTGELLIGTAGSLAFEGSTADAYETFLAVVDPTADRTITLPNIDGTVITSGDTGTVTSAMIANGTIVDADVNGAAAISGSKLQAASTANAGAVQLTDSISSTSTTTAATPNAVKSAYDLANAALPKAGGAVTGDLTLNAQSDLRFADSDSSNWVAFQAPSTVAASVIWTLPAADGAAAQVLSTNGSGALSWATTSAGSGEFPSGTVLLFQQTNAPTGWTKLTTHNNKALRVVSGAAGSGGTSDFTTVFTSRTPTGSVSVSGSIGSTTTTGSVSVSGSVGYTTLSTSQMPSHSHYSYDVGYGGGLSSGADFNGSVYTASSSAGGGQSHNHDFYGSGSFSGNSHSHSFSGSGSFTGSAMDFAVQYVDIILASKN
jgi:hypothetical protein